VTAGSQFRIGLFSLPGPQHQAPAIGRLPTVSTALTPLAIDRDARLASAPPIHLALHELAVRVLPQYEPDSGALTPAQLKQVRKLAGKVDTSLVRSSLFGDEPE